MAWLTFHGGSKIVIDGFVQMNDYLKEYLDRNKSRFSKLKPNKLTDDQIIDVFACAVKELRAKFCPYIINEELANKYTRKNGVERQYSHHQASVFVNKNKLRAKTTAIALFKKDYPEMYDLLYAEYKHDKDNGRRVYVQNLIDTPFKKGFSFGHGKLACEHPYYDFYLNEEPTICGGLEKKCARFWIDKIGFRIKQDNEYKNSEGFAKAWKELGRYV